MRKLSLSLLLLICCIFSPILQGTTYAQQRPTPVSFNADGNAMGVIHIKFAPSTASHLQLSNAKAIATAQLGIATFDAVVKQFQGHDLKRLFPYDPKFEHKLQKHGLHLWYELSYDLNSDPLTVCQTIGNLAEVEISEPILAKRLIGGESGVRRLTKAEIEAFSTTENAATMNDPLLSNQWHYDNDGSAGKREDASINLAEAWAQVTGNKEVIVSIHDAGIDVQHEDLINNMWINEAELNGTDGVDDDGNGYIDDVYGFNFSNNSGAIDPMVHGTHVAGTVAATTNNGIGVAGVAGGSGNNDGVRLMACQILSDNGGNEIANSYVYAANNGAVISQNSWGYIAPGNYEQSVLDAIDYFIAEAGDYEGSPMRGGIVIFAAGNDGVDNKYYPGYYESCLTVASSNGLRERSSYSNFGEWVDLTAPGGDTRLGTSHGVLSTLPDNEYGYLQGTSMACPHVSGVAALVVSRLGNETFSQDVLRNQLLFGTHSMDESAPNYIGKLGTGLIDAALAIKENDGIAPEVVQDIEVLAKSSDFVDLQWTVPSDEDDDQPSKFMISYSAGTFNEETAKSVFVFSKLEAGAKFDYRLENLSAETNYEIAIKGFDRWGNASAYSEVISVGTNLGPQMSYPMVDNAWSYSVEINADAAEKSVWESSFTLGNTNEALLEWSLETRQKSYTIKNWATPSLGYEVKNSGKSLILNRVVPMESVRNEDYEPLNPFVKEYLSYTNYFYATFLIGDNDTSIPNMTASAFKVENENGFNVTKVDAYLNDITSGQATYEVYHGNILSQAKLVFSKKVEETDEGNHELTLDDSESYYVPYGDIVWLVVKVPAGNLYPIGISSTNDHKDAVNYQWMSFDEGKSFVPLSIALGTDEYSFTQGIFTDEEYQGDFISLTPYEGQINGEGETEVTFTADVSKIKNGDVKTNIIISSNDENADGARIPTIVKVSGHDPELITPGIVNYGSVQLGREKDIAIKLENYGYGVFKGSLSVTGLEGTAFSVVDKPSRVSARSTEDLVVRFQPDMAGNTNAVLTITDKNGFANEINLFGNGEEPSEINITPEVQLFNLAHGASTSSSIVIENTGNFPLEFNIPKYSDKPSFSGHKFGYSWELKTEDFVWEELDGMEGTVDVSNQFKENPFLDFVEVELGFQYPFYDTLVDKMYMSHIGLIAVDDKDPVNGSWGELLGSSFTSNGYFAIYYEYFDLLYDSKILYKTFDDKVIFEYKNVHSKVTYGESGDPLTFQLVLHYNGHAEMRYLDLSYSNIKSIGPMLGMESPDKKDGIYFYDKSHQPNFLFEKQWQNVWIDINYPGPQIVSNLSQTNGFVGVGESKEITFDVNTDGLVEGMNTQFISVENNDPFQQIAHFQINVDINEGGEAIVKTSEKAIDFGPVYKGSDKMIMLTFLNEGNSNTDIVSTTFEENTKLSVDKSTFELRAKLGTQVKLYLNTDELGEINEQVTFTQENGDTHVFEVKANIVKAPNIALNYTVDPFVLPTGDKDEFTVEISNLESDTTLRVLVEGSNWVYEKAADVEVNALPDLRDFTYFSKDNDRALAGLEDKDAPTFKWIDIVNNGGTKLEFDQSTMSAEVEFNKPVPFYGKMYDKAWMGYPGIITFSEPTQLVPIINNIIPYADGFNNFIASLWGLTGYDYFDENLAKGIYFYQDDEKVVFTYHRWVHSFGEGAGGLVDTQTIIYFDGRIKIQYKTINQGTVDFWNQYLVIGLENEDGTEGVLTSYGKSLAKDKLVIEYHPSTVMNVEAGETKEVTFEVNAHDMVAGNYYTDLTFLNHTPGKENISIPVELEVTADSKLSWDTEEIDLGDIVYEEFKNYKYEFALENNSMSHHTLKTGDIVADASLNLELWGILEEVDPWLPMTPVPGWVPYESYFNEFYIATSIPAGENMKAQIRIIPSEAGLFEGKITVNNADGSSTDLVVKANFYLPPVYESDVADTLSVNALTHEYVETKQFTVSNENGAYPLDYQFDIEYVRKGLPMNEVYSAQANNASIKSSVVGANAIQGTSTIDHNDFHQVLYYGEVDAEKVQSIGYGGGQSMISITKFVTPEEGFQLSHVSTWYSPSGVKNGDVKVEILSGTIDNLVLVYEETFATETSSSDQVGRLELFELSTPLEFFNGENIFIAFTYEKFSGYPQGMMRFEESIPETFYFHTTQGLIDITEDIRFSDFGYYVRAYGKNAGSDSWFSLDQYSGTVEVGESQTINAGFNSANSRGESNLLAKINVTTNDPNMVDEDAQFYAAMMINTAPQMIEGITELTINEGEEITFTYTFEDVEEHTFSLEVKDFVDFGSFTTTDNSISLELAPTFDDANDYAFTIVASDEHGVSSETAIQLTVENVNRAPEAIEQDTIVLSVGDVYYLSTSETFVDPDGDELTFSIADNNDGLAITGIANDEFIISALKEGITEVAVIASDADMASSVQVIPVKIEAASTDEEEDEDEVTNITEDKVTYNLYNYPNPVLDHTTFTFELPENGEVEINIYTLQGKSVDRIKLGQQHVGKVNYEYATDRLQAGVYVYTLIVNGEVKLFGKMIK
ncbi:S8 family serine peptidase [Flammeovirga sp. SubArs3]|uniref:S8 family serine peptidase n=1 Tax=Flammeovirga sp. SubArs3 TaxID=2995316 RepID=UPI00248AEC79|nr:S8 family serine peptidase [Flammeovirga sp. SubArs3]